MPRTFTSKVRLNWETSMSSTLSGWFKTLRSSEARAMQHATTPNLARAASKLVSSFSSDVISVTTLKTFGWLGRLSSLDGLTSAAVTRAPTERNAVTHALPRAC